MQSFDHDLVDLRRTYITMVMYACIDPFLVQRLAGHSNSSTTALYDHCSGSLRRATMERMPALLTDRHDFGTSASG